jgi:hypothetical protein
MNIRRQKLIQILLAVIILWIATAAVFTHILKSKKTEIDRLSNNVTALAEEKARMQVLTLKEYKRRDAENDSLREKLKIRAKDVKYQVEIKYNYRDTFIHSTPLGPVEKIPIHDTIYPAKEFIFDEPCYYIRGFQLLNFEAITEHISRDKLTIFMDRSYEKKFLWFRWSPYMTVKAYSECKGDTVAIEKFYHIVKNKAAWRQERVK